MKRALILVALAELCLLVAFTFKMERIEEQNKCCRVLFNEDIITSECEKHFEGDFWYEKWQKVPDNNI